MLRFILAMAIVVCACGFRYLAFAADVPANQLEFEFRVVNAAGEYVTYGYVGLGWNGCDGDQYVFSGFKDEPASTGMALHDSGSQRKKVGYTVFTGAGMPIGPWAHFAFWAGNADFSALDGEVFDALFSGPVEVTPRWCCQDGDGDLYLYETGLSLPGGVVRARAWMPASMKLELYAPGTMDVSGHFVPM